MELPEPKGKTYSVKLDANTTFRIERYAEAVQMKPAALLRDIIEGWLSKR